MSLNELLFWFAVVSTAGSYFMLRRSGPNAWTRRALIVLIVCFATRLLVPQIAGYISGILWFISMLLPALLFKRTFKHLQSYKYAAAVPVSKFAAFLSPGKSGQALQGYACGLAAVVQGETQQGVELLKSACLGEGEPALLARAQLGLIEGNWESLASVLLQQWQLQPLLFKGALWGVLIRSLGESGRLGELITIARQRYITYGSTFRTPPDAESTMMLAAFLGVPELVEKVITTLIPHMPEISRNYWYGVALMSYGEAAKAREHLSQVIKHSADGELALCAKRKLVDSVEPVSFRLDSALLQIRQEIFSQLTREAEDQEILKFSLKNAPVTLVVLCMVLIGFGIELLHGTTESLEILKSLGGLLVSRVIEHGEWWRLTTAPWLHFGVIHLLMNLIGIGLLGPLVERSYGKISMATITIFSAIGSMLGVVLMFMGDTAQGEPLVVGASGIVLGYVGALAVDLWHRAKNRNTATARYYSRGALIVILLQLGFDLIHPEISLSAHLSGLLVGGILSLMLGNHRELKSSVVTVQ